MKWDLFQVQVNEKSELKFEQILQELVSPADGRKRNLEKGDVVIRLQALRVAKPFVFGNIQRIEMRNLPVPTRLNGQTRELALDPDEGMGNEAFFAFHQYHKILLLQRNRNAISCSQFVKYLEQKLGLRDVINVCPVIRKDTLLRLLKAREVRSIAMKIASPDVAILQADADTLGVQQVLALAEDLNSPFVELSFSMGHRKGTLALQKVLSLFGGAFNAIRNKNGQVQKFIAKAVDADGMLHEFDVLSDRIVAEISTHQSNKGQVLPFQVREHLAIQAWSSCKAELLESLGVSDE